MGSQDFKDSIKEIKYEQVSPLRMFDDPENTEVILTCDYPHLASLFNTQEIAQACLNEEMEQWLTKQGYCLLDISSPECQQLLQSLNNNANAKLGNSTKGSVGAKEIGIGTPIMVERNDPSDPRRKINIIFGAVRVTKKERSDFGKYYILAHPVGKDGIGQLTLSPNHRTDHSHSFDPPLWYIETKHPFGYHGTFADIVSYPLQEGIPLSPEIKTPKENRVIKTIKSLLLSKK